MINVIVTYNDDEQIKDLKDFSNIKLIDTRTRKGNKEAWSLKSHWSAKLDPFVLITKGDKPIRAFYTEAGDSIKDLINYINEER